MTKSNIAPNPELSLIRLLRSGGVSRVELARAMNLAPSTVGLYVDRLIDNGFLREGSKSKSNPGRPRVILELNPQAGYFVGVEFEARQLSAVSLDFSHRTLQRRRTEIRSSDTAESVLEKIEKAIASVGGPDSRLLGVGVAVPGTVDSKRGVAIHYEFIQGWRDVPIVQRLKKRFHVPVHLENNVRAMALAERWFGLARDVDNFICFGVRSGIGAGVVIDGQLYRGRNNFAGEIGGWPCPAEFSAEEAAGVTLEQQASVRAIMQHITDAAAKGEATYAMSESEPLTIDSMLQAARDGDRLVREILRRSARIIGRAITQISVLLNPEQIVIAGPLADLGDLFLEPIREVVAALMPDFHAKMPRIVATQLGDFGGAMGAAAMAVNQWTPAS